MTLDSILKVWLDRIHIAAFLIKDDLWILLRSPPADPVVVMAGAAELFDIKFKV